MSDRSPETTKQPGTNPNQGGRPDADPPFLTTDQGVRIGDNQNSLKAGPRGPTLMEDFLFREKMTSFDHERIPERVVHARGSGAHGYFQVYESLADLTSAAFLQDPSVKTPVFVRFSTVVGFRGSADTVRDARGFATKFYTSAGNYDLVGNNMPVFFIQDALKFPDLVHAIKPEPHNELPQASAAHDNFWDFISLTPESMHMIMWVLSDRALPRSYAQMEGFGVHTFRLVDAEGGWRFAKFHWKPIEGMQALVWDETQKIAGKDPDFNRRQLWESIEQGRFPTYELGLQVFTAEQAAGWDFDHLDATKLIPEELVPVRRVGRMVLDRNPDNFFAETEQSAFHPGHLVPGIDFSEDPLLQGRLFSYRDTQLTRLGGPNFAQIPINRPKAPVASNQQDGFMRQENPRGRVNYEPNSLAGGLPRQATAAEGGFHSAPVDLSGRKLRERSPTFSDHFAQATLFWNSLTAVEQRHLIEAAQFELGKVERMAIRERLVALFNRVDHRLAREVAAGVGVAPPERDEAHNHGRSSPVLSMLRDPLRSPKGRMVAMLVAEGVARREMAEVKAELTAAGALVKVVAARGGMLAGDDGGTVEVEQTFSTTASVVFDAVYVPGGARSAATLVRSGDALHFLNEAFRHAKPIAASGAGVDVLAATAIRGPRLATDAEPVVDQGVVTARPPAPGVVQTVKHLAGGETPTTRFAAAFLTAIAAHRHWDRPEKDAVPA